jgi:hypothetical protein
VGHIHHKNGANVFGYLGKAFKINRQRVGAGTGNDEFWPGFMGLAFHCVIVNGFIGVQSITHDIEPFSTHVQGHAMGQVAPFCQTHPHDGVTGLQERQKHRFIRRCATVGLDIGRLGAKNLFYPVDGKLLGNIDKLTTPVVAFAGVSLGVLVGQLGSLCGHHCGRSVVFAGNQFNVVLLALILRLDGGIQFGVSLFDQNFAVKHGSPLRR